MTAQLKAKLWSIDFQTSWFILLNNKGSTPHPQWTQEPHITQACPYLPVHRCPEGLPYPLLVPQLTYIFFATFFRVSSLDCRVQSYQLASNGLVAPNGVKLISE
ncbi:hypothetical protein PROFUN_16499 [Planoprotostelium fungivorum]|uniref:Uncharacterized protein n=1 Tax=Planoprotostelium fungivorum TaxID=1890364 RepID=A0A2P6MQA8_9EUKA|nr:hypothetical protein PROFUN_16499 [Planoprotostelium fungivorum]